MANVALSLSLALAVTFVAERAHAQRPPIHTSNPLFQASLERIAKGSPSWREALAAVGATGRRVVVVTPDQVRVVDPASGSRERFDESLLAEVVPIVGARGQVDVVVVIVNLPLLREAYRERALLPVEIDMDLDRILVHEIYGHAVPYLLAGSLAGRCADPQERERVVDACSIQRENAIRAELGLGRRVEYGLDGLNLSRRR